MKQIIRKINQLADELTKLRDIRQANEQEKTEITGAIINYSKKLDKAGSAGSDDYMMASAEIIQKQRSEKEKYKLLIDVEREKISIVQAKNTKLVSDIMRVKAQLKEARGEYLEAKEKVLLQDPVFIKALALISECVTVGYTAFEGFLDSDGLKSGLLEDLPEISNKKIATIEKDLRADIVTGVGRL